MMLTMIRPGFSSTRRSEHGLGVYMSSLRASEFRRHRCSAATRHFTSRSPRRASTDQQRPEVEKTGTGNWIAAAGGGGVPPSESRRRISGR